MHSSVKEERKKFASKMFPTQSIATLTVLNPITTMTSSLAKESQQ